MAVGYPTFPMEPPWLLVIWRLGSLVLVVRSLGILEVYFWVNYQGNHHIIMVFFQVSVF